ncbi:hypothetical protein AOL_s00043g250 [Orbilia oligospora ATCC 24927]|uniref:Arrestin-like N-terminal domain-containing protein n=2 Tax=Orbilia oligospora TaxID=2813651 RepID=G1X3H7_ARTOA|nr:hypothetical protein AOL_s00043g250 [Orbilia oligospora ATCC 24927]EGX52461.1 hypothetical protein AOL_s00043g250 [Orbilia oligospora ATCC 24927]KAF3289336.1 hypothetical protein TWF970_003116 [Orbilia oligospora]
MGPMEINLDTKGPLPGIPGSRINLYVAGDTVSGHVKVHVAREAIKSLTIEFTGNLHAQLISGSRLQQKNSLFNFTVSPTTSADGVYPFSFQLPGTVVVAPDESMAPRHVPIAPQSLLPSFTFGLPNENMFAKVEYLVIAKLVHKGTIFTKRDSETKTINISAAPIEDLSLLSSSPASHIFQLQTPKLRPGMEHYKPTAMERFSSFLGNVHQGFQDPKILVDLGAELPNSLALGSQIPTSISINLLPDSHGIETPPRIYLLKAEAKLQIITELAVQTGTKKKMTSMDLCSRGWDSRTMPIEYGYQHKIDLTNWVSENFVHDVGNQLVPTFHTANLKRKYRLDLEIWLECVGEVWKKTFERELVLLPAYVGEAPKAPLPTPAPTRTLTAASPVVGEKAMMMPMNSIQPDAVYDAPPPEYTELQGNP